MITRNAKVEDLNEILAIESESFDSDRFNPRQMRYLLTKAQTAVWVVDDDAGKVGAYAIQFTPGRTSVSRVYSIAVAERMRGRGCGRALLRKMERHAAESGYKQLRLEVRQENVPARSLYESEGFVACSSIADYYGSGFAAIRYEKVLCADLKSPKTLG